MPRASRTRQPLASARSLARAAAALLATGAISLPAFAQAPSEIELVGVIPVGELQPPTPELIDLAQQLRAVVAERLPGVLEAAAIKDRMAGQTSTASLAELDRAYAGALATYQSGDFEGAVRTLRAVIDDLEKLPDGPDAFDQWTRAMMRLARADQTLGRKDEASAVVDRLVRAAPSVKVDATQYPPSFAKYIEDAKARLKGMPKHKLTVTSSRKVAKVFLEGRDIGSTPVTVTVPAGQYRVSGKVGESRIPRTGVDLSNGDQTVAFDAALVDMMRPATGGLSLPPGDRNKMLVQAGALLGLDKLLAVSLFVQDDVTYLAGASYDVRRGALERHGNIRLTNRQPPPGSMAKFADFLITGTLPPDGVVLGGGVGDHKQPVNGVENLYEPPKPSKSKTLGWTAFGAGVVSVGAGVFAVAEAFSAKSSYNEASSMLDGNTLKIGADPAHYQQLVAAGDSAKSKATMGAGAAIGTAVLSGVLGYLAYKQTGEVGPFRF
ncbi:MAG: PEGA domain-containing protein [Myxococcales bacterium]